MTQPHRYRKTRSLTLSPVVWEIADRVLPLGEIHSRSRLFEEALIEYLQKRGLYLPPSQIARHD